MSQPGGLLTPHFSLAEMTATNTGIRNVPTGILMDNLRRTAQLLEKARKVLGDKPITVLSGYRNPSVNQAVGGSKTSDHMLGLAVDFLCPSFGPPPAIVAAIAKSDLLFDQLILEGKKRPDSTGWVHLGIGQRMRRMILTARFEDGAVIYSPWSAAA